ncbi:hypothetical protein [Pararhodobacter zhoushanensis]|uniref:Uncharacterized protein n=1 Tax=Pararhodobacter zhoushanensis TaxID=2479545 RepID=A0ABT3GW95_9RHOB|nr:hypothetical protein [Pararhodobacter zhoushanensis]MCW1931819.1 hypothetical protein [Pararhodobacter zhoushanensis]
MRTATYHEPSAEADYVGFQEARRIIELELEFERAVAKNRDLALFRRNAATWEMLLAALAAGDDDRIGVYDLVESVTSTGLGSSALLRFVRDRRDDGLFVFGADPKKKSKHRISLNDDLAEAALALLEQRNQALRKATLETANAPVPFQSEGRLLRAAGRRD